jgi:hypothetical protein
VVNRDSATRAADSTANAKDLQELQYTYPVVKVPSNSTKQPKVE